MLVAALVVHVVAVIGRALLIPCVAITILPILALLLLPGQGLVVGRRGAVIAGIGTDLLLCRCLGQTRHKDRRQRRPEFQAQARKL